tara:strand:- start:584 stop:1675 length:1092 start_codon:yes stop_codon:yes gene_type:complete
MSEPSPERYGSPHDGRPSLPSLVWGARSDALHHHMMLERCFDGREARWSDALIARTRRHIGGCIAAVEMGFRVEMANTAIAGLNLVDALPQDYCWRALQHRPTLLSTALLRHFRDRAALSLMGQEAGDVPGAMEEIRQDAALAPDAAQTLSALALVQAGWKDTGPDHLAMRADLPAEAMQDLVWTVGALVTEALVRSDLLPASDAVVLVDRAGHALLARHDEQNSPFALAALLALQMSGAPATGDQLVSLARGRHVMALIGLMAQRNAMDVVPLTSAVVETSEQMVFNLCRAADFPREVAVRLVLGRRSVSRGVEDSVLVEYADRYEQMAREDAQAAVITLRLDEIFRDRLSALGHEAGRHVG